MYEIEFDYIKKEFVKPMKENLSLKDKKDFDIYIEHYNNAVNLWNKEKINWDGKEKVNYHSWTNSINFINLEETQILIDKMKYKDCLIKYWNDTENIKKYFSIMYQSVSLIEKFDNLDDATKFIDKNHRTITLTQHSKVCDENSMSLN